VDEVLQLVDAVTAADVARVCRDFFDPTAYTALSLGPASGDPGLGATAA
jgi:hypothetical protein